MTQFDCNSDSQLFLNYFKAVIGCFNGCTCGVYRRLNYDLLELINFEKMRKLFWYNMNL